MALFALHRFLPTIVSLGLLFALNQAAAETPQAGESVGLILNDIPRIELKALAQISKEGAVTGFFKNEIHHNVASLVTAEGASTDWIDLGEKIYPARQVQAAMFNIKTCEDFLKSPRAYPAIAGKFGEIWLGEITWGCDLASVLSKSIAFPPPPSPRELPLVQALCDPNQQASDLFLPPKEFRTPFPFRRKGSRSRLSLKDSFSAADSRFDVLTCDELANLWGKPEVKDREHLDATLVFSEKKALHDSALSESNATVLSLRPYALVKIDNEHSLAVFVIASWSSSTGNFALCQHSVLGLSRKSGLLEALRPWSPVYRCG